MIYFYWVSQSSLDKSIEVSSNPLRVLFNLLIHQNQIGKPNQYFFILLLFVDKLI